jgi:hypothetical protein
MKIALAAFMLDVIGFLNLAADRIQPLRGVITGWQEPTAKRRARHEW